VVFIGAEPVKSGWMGTVYRLTPLCGGVEAGGKRPPAWD